MKRRILLPLAVILIVATAAVAQQYRNGGGTPPAGPQSVITGAVISFTASAGTGMPSLVVQTGGSNVTLVLGPYWFLQNAKFTATAGDQVEATVIACTGCPGGLAVVAIRNVTTGVSLTLRNADGVPLWQANGDRRGPGGRHQGQPGNGNGPGNPNGPASGRGNCAGSGPDMTQVATFDGTVVSFTGGAGAGRPTLVFSTGGTEKTFIVAPYRALMNAGLELNQGQALTLTAAPNVNGEWVVITLVDKATGAALTLRDGQTGLPQNGGGRGRC